ncbi:hypothetical protein [Amnibacterium kyonggiense]|uniref:DUF4157 domain-containing protein n=1 Tax=Amnibacterium kyonggiense TaxID=595671 RepID=A0A4V3EB38_9MICO|nr:hypothetical protein [Amnibacterium kyonggiense]TDS80234.1 hypothetical protein CLV52_0789 [Amnibacterium kyonggiense]
MVRLRRVGNLLNLSTPLGVLLATAGRARIRGGPHGLLLAEGCRLPFPDAGAMTIGDVVLTTGRFGDLVGRFPRVLDHEARHADQWLRWGGLPFLPAYLFCAGWSLLRTGDRAVGNRFERAAGLADGGYPDPPPRR